ncbi:MAG: hypothetical protein AAGU74_03650 [Bacillota bacterium]
MKIAVDLHIHSCLSPCSDMDMTPNNIANMARLKGLDAIAVSDHNSAGNLLACKTAAEAAGLLFVPAIEAESAEEVHVLCYFHTVEDALKMGEVLYQHLPDIKNTPKFFGEQLVADDRDNPVGSEPRLLVQSTDLSVDSIAKVCRSLHGVPVPAHINRASNSILSSLGFIPEHLDLRSVEVARGMASPPMELESYRVFCSSDAHELSSILEREQFIDVFERSVDGILAYLDAKNSC